MLNPRHFTLCYRVFTSILSWKEWLGSEASKASPAKISRVPTHQIRDRDSPNTNQPATAWNIQESCIIIYSEFHKTYLDAGKKMSQLLHFCFWTTGRCLRAKFNCAVTYNLHESKNHCRKVISLSLRYNNHSLLKHPGRRW